MNKHRRKTDEFLAKVKIDMIKKEYSILEIGTGRSNHLCVMFQDYDFQPTDKYLYPGCVPGIKQLDGEYFSRSQLVRDSETGWWDAIFFCESLERCAHPWLVFKEAYDHLRWGGIFVVTAPCYYPIHESRTGKGPGHVEVKDYWRVTPRGLGQLFRDARFKTYYIGELHARPELPASQPYSVVGWGEKTPGAVEKVQLTTWNPELPDDWVKQHKIAERRWLEAQKEA